jgi:hypothetical protein
MSCSSKCISIAQEGCFSPRNGSFEDSGIRSAFRRLSAGSVIRGAPESIEQGGAPDRYLESVSCLDGWQTRSLQSLEGVVAAIQASAEAVEKLRQAFEDVGRENFMAAQAEVEVLESFS